MENNGRRRDMARKRTVEEPERIHLFLPKELREYVDLIATQQGYGSTRSSVIREIILKHKKEREEK
jgi:metal-responsive CopG/Arc/MetJ family transcriptional regulator